MSDAALAQAADEAQKRLPPRATTAMVRALRQRHLTGAQQTHLTEGLATSFKKKNDMNVSVMIDVHVEEPDDNGLLKATATVQARNGKEAVSMLVESQDSVISSRASAIVQRRRLGAMMVEVLIQHLETDGTLAAMENDSTVYVWANLTMPGIQSQRPPSSTARRAAKKADSPEAQAAIEAIDVVQQKLRTHSLTLTGGTTTTAGSAHWWHTTSDAWGKQALEGRYPREWKAAGVWPREYVPIKRGQHRILFPPQVEGAEADAGAGTGTGIGAEQSTDTSATTTIGAIPATDEGAVTDTGAGAGMRTGADAEVNIDPSATTTDTSAITKQTASTVITPLAANLHSLIASGRQIAENIQRDRDNEDGDNNTCCSDHSHHTHHHMQSQDQREAATHSQGTCTQRPVDDNNDAGQTAARDRLDMPDRFKCKVTQCECNQQDFYIRKNHKGKVGSMAEGEHMLACPFCDHGLYRYSDATRLAVHWRNNCIGHSACTEPQYWLGDRYEAVDICNKCGDPFTGVSGHVKNCTGKRKVDRSVFVPESYSAEISAEEADRVVQLFTPAFLMHPRNKIPHQTREKKIAVALKTIREAQIDSARHHTKDDHESAQSQAAFALLIATQQLMAGPNQTGDNDGGKSNKISIAEANRRVGMVVQGDYRGMYTALREMQTEIKVRAAVTGEEGAPAKAKAVSAKIKNGTLGAAHGRAASAAVPVQLIENFHEHEEIANLTAEAHTIKVLEPGEHTCDKHDVSPSDTRKAVWSLVKGASPGADGFYREDLMMIDPVAAAELISIIVHGRLPPGYRGLMAGGMLTALSKPGKDETEIRPIIPQSLWVRAAAKWLLQTHKAPIKEALGPYQTAVFRPKGAEQAFLTAALHLEKNENGAMLLADFKSGYPSARRVDVAKVLREKAPHLLGYFESVYGEHPAAGYIMQNQQGHAELVLKFVKDGLVQGDPLAPTIFSMLQAPCREENNQSSTGAAHFDHLDDIQLLGTTAPNDTSMAKEPEFELAQMLQKAVTHAETWGGHLSPKKTVLYVKHINADVHSLVEKLKLINGGEVRLACPSLHDVKQQGVAFLGSPLGSDAFIVQEWQEALEKKKMADNVFYKLSQQDQFLLTKFCLTTRYNHLARTDLRPHITRDTREQIDRTIFGFGDEEDSNNIAGYMMGSILGINSANLDTKQRKKLLQRIQMRSKDGGLGVTSVTETGEYASLAALAALANSDFGQHLGLVQWWEKELMKKADDQSAMVQSTQQRMQDFKTLNAKGIESMKSRSRMDGYAVIVPQEPRHLLNGNAILQKHMHDVVSAQKREQWTATATEDEKFQFEAHSNMDHLIPLHTIPTSPCLVIPNAAHRAMMRVAVLLPDKALPSFSSCACGTRIKGNSPWAVREHAYGCRKFNGWTQTHDQARNELALMAAHCGVSTQREGKIGSRHVEPRALANTNGFQGGADLLLSGLAILEAGEKNAALVDVTFPAATAASNETATRKWAPMENIDKFEEKKLAHTDYHADAAINGWDFYPCATFKDTLTSGTRMQLLMGRLAATRGRVEFNGDLHREYGCREGMWTTSNVLHYWRARMLIKLAVSRETHIKKISDKLHHSPVHSQ